MSGFHESIKTLLAEVEKFLLETLKNEKLGKSAKNHKQEIVDRINKLKEEWPALGMLSSDQVKTSKDLPKDDESSRTGGSSTADDAEDPYVDSSADIPNVPATELTDFTKAGYLDKKRPSGLRTMQKRWCVIKGNIFYYFSDNTSKKMSGAFRLTDYSFELAPDIVKDEKKKELCFKLVRPANRTYEFMAPSKVEFDEWKATVKKVSAMTQDSPQIEAMDDDGDIYEPVGDDADQSEPVQEELYDDGTEGDIYEAEPEAARAEPEPIQDDIYDDGQSAPVEEEEYEDASTGPPVTPPVAPPPRKRDPLPTVPDEDPYKSSHRPLPSTPVPEEAPLPPPPRKTEGLPPPPIKEEPKSYRKEEDFENMFIGKWDCTGDNEKELSFKKGDIVYIINRDFDDKSWWVGELDGKFGLVPKNYLTMAYEVAL